MRCWTNWTNWNWSPCPDGIGNDLNGLDIDGDDPDGLDIDDDLVLSEGLVRGVH